MRYIVLALAFLFAKNSYCQTDTELTVTTGQSTSDRSAYIKSYPDNFFIWPVLKQRKLDFEFQNQRGSDDQLLYRTNKPYSLGLGMYLFEVGFELAFAIPLNEQSKRIYGESEARDLQLNVLGKRWGIDAYYQRYSGFYIDDPEHKVPSGRPYPQRGDIATRNLGVTLNYTFNHNKFSFRSAYNFAERQLESAGSLIAFATLDNFSVNADSAIVGKNYESRFGLSSKIEDVSSTIFALAPGYTYSLIYKGFFLNGMLALGPGSNWLRYNLEEEGNKKDLVLSAFVAARIALGYNGDRVFGGLTFMSLGRNARFDDVALTSSNTSFKILVGYRFQEWGILEKRALDIPRSLFR